MKSTRILGSTLAGMASVAALAAPASAACTDPPRSFDVTRVKLVEGGEAAKVRVTVACPAGVPYAVAVEVIQDTTPGGLFEAYYHSTEPTRGTCTGRLQRLDVRVVPDTTGAFSDPDGRLTRGPAYETVGGTYDDLPTFVEDHEPVR